MNTLKNLLRKGITIGSFCLVSGTILSAQISLSMQNKSTREVIREIEKVSDYRFFYNDNLSGLNFSFSSGRKYPGCVGTDKETGTDHLYN